MAAIRSSTELKDRPDVAGGRSIMMTGMDNCRAATIFAYEPLPPELRQTTCVTPLDSSNSDSCEMSVDGLPVRSSNSAKGRGFPGSSTIRKNEMHIGSLREDVQILPSQRQENGGGSGNGRTGDFQ